MPGFDRKGPEGKGPMTGRKMGYCGGNKPDTDVPRGRGFGRGEGFGAGRGLGRGLGRGFGRGQGRGLGRGFGGRGLGYGRRQQNDD
jgi:hypothetical protein